ncbi:MAG: MgtC/SapB family protein [Nanoarchaeota archaeon]|nr:MgtC/SapB family protein [Nanoarchaeota archaeon]
MVNILSGHETEFIIKLLLSMIAGYIIGYERELRGKSAGVRTHCYVIAGSMLFTFLSIAIDPSSPGRIAAQIVTGIGFLGAGIILKDREGHINNLTTAATIWYSASIGIAIGFGWYFITVLAVIYAVIVPKLPSLDHADDKKRK